MDSTFHKFPKEEAGGSRLHEPLETKASCTDLPSPRPNFIFLDTMTTNRPWLAVDSIAVLVIQHPFTKHPEKLLPKFDPNNDVTPEDHIKKIIL